VHVIEERGVVVSYGGIGCARTSCRGHISQASHGYGVGTCGQGLVLPVELILNLQLLPERADDAAKAPIVRCAHAKFMTLMGIVFLFSPHGAWRITGRSQSVCR